MERSVFSSEVSERWGRIRLLNLMLQRESGIIGDDLLRDFATFAADWHSGKKGNSPCRISTPVKGSRIHPNDFYRRAACRPVPPDDGLLVRCISLNWKEWAKFRPQVSGASSGSMKTAFEAVKTDLRKLTSLSKPFDFGKIERAENGILRLVNSIRDLQNDEFADPIQSKLPLIRVSPMPLHSVHGREGGIDNRPRFTTVFDCGGSNQELIMKKCFSTDAGTRADAFRDLLGLDHYRRDFLGAPVILGFIAYRFGDLMHKEVHRPTQLDDASRWRFRGIHGSKGGRIGEYGRTVNLEKIETSNDAHANNEMTGAIEAIVHDSKLDPTKHMYLGFAGVLRLPRGDFRGGDGSKRTALARCDVSFEKHLSQGVSDADLEKFFVDGSV